MSKQDEEAEIDNPEEMDEELILAEEEEEEEEEGDLEGAEEGASNDADYNSVGYTYNFILVFQNLYPVSMFLCFYIYMLTLSWGQTNQNHAVI